MSWQIALLLLCLIILCVVGVVYAIHDDRMLIKDRELNAHKVTPKFNVGRDVK
jgi:cell division protein FtsL